jgi:hypothetical protein
MDNIIEFPGPNKKKEGDGKEKETPQEIQEEIREEVGEENTEGKKKEGKGEVIQFPSPKEGELSKIADRLFQQAVDAENNFGPEKAERFYKDILRVFPDHARASFNLSTLILSDMEPRSEDEKKYAVYLLYRSAELDPSNLRYKLAIAHFHSLEGGIDNFEQADRYYS